MHELPRRRLSAIDVAATMDLSAERSFFCINLNIVFGFRASFPGGDLKFKVKELFTCKVHNEGRMGDSVFVSAVIV